MGQALGFAGTYSAEPFERLSLRFLPHPLIPNHQALLSHELRNEIVEELNLS
jgi:hypothetical protein